MSQKYLIAKARNQVTGQSVKNQDLTGARYRLDQKSIAEDMANQLAKKMTARTNEPWVGFVEEYTPTYRKN